jgi:hypothetical protein
MERAFPCATPGREGCMDMYGLTNEMMAVGYFPSRIFCPETEPPKAPQRQRKRHL